MTSDIQRDYQRIDEAWKSAGDTLAVPSPKEAMTGFKRLYRHLYGKPWRGKVEATSGRRFTWARRGVYYVNPDRDGHHRGWQGIVHDVSHRAHQQLNPGMRPHCPKHIDLELKAVRYVLDNGFLTGALQRRAKPAAPKDAKIERYKRVCKRIAQWESKLKRAQNALKKLRASKKAYERRGVGV